MFDGVPQGCILLAVKIERITVRIAEITGFCKKVGKELLVSGAAGCLCGLGIGFSLFTRLGFPKDIYLAGYLSGLFLVAGAKFGFSVGVIRSLVFRIARHLQGSK
jgi:hypothetical protein